MPQLRFDDRVAVTTGGAKGLGRSYALLPRIKGSKDCRKRPGRQPRRPRHAALNHYRRIDILIHNAGNTRHASIKEMTQEDFDAVIDVHLRGAFHVSRPAFPLMDKGGHGRIVLTSSIGGLWRVQHSKLLFGQGGPSGAMSDGLPFSVQTFLGILE